MRWLDRSQGRGMLVLAIWLIASGLTPFLHLGSFSIGPVLAVLAIVAGVLILLGR